MNVGKFGLSYTLCDRCYQIKENLLYGKSYSGEIPLELFLKKTNLSSYIWNISTVFLLSVYAFES